MEVCAIENSPDVLFRKQALKNALIGKKDIAEAQSLEHLQYNQEGSMAIERDWRLIHPGPQIEGFPWVCEWLVRKEYLCFTGEIAISGGQGVVQGK